MLNVTEKRILAALRAIAHKRNKIGYGALSNLCNLGLNVNDVAQRLRLSGFLGNIIREEVAEGRPAVSVLVVREKDGMPGKGFFECMDELGLRVGTEDNVEMFVRVLKLTHDFYNTTLGVKLLETPKPVRVIVKAP